MIASTPSIKSLSTSIKSIGTYQWLTSALWTVARVWVGWQFLQAGLDKVGQQAWTGSLAGAGIKGFLGFATSPTMTAGAHPSVLGPFTWLVTTIVLPQAALFSYLVAFGEVFVGIALIAGLFTRFAAFWGAFLNLLFMMAGSTGVSPYMFTIELSILLVGTTAGLIGLDLVVLPFVKAQIARYQAQHDGHAVGTGLRHGGVAA